MYGSDETFGHAEQSDDVFTGGGLTSSPSDGRELVDDEQTERSESRLGASAPPRLQPTIGERRVRTEFNPGNNSMVQNTKEAFAHMINRVEHLKEHPLPVEVLPERDRCIEKAKDALEIAAMWAVKAATF